MLSILSQFNSQTNNGNVDIDFGKRTMLEPVDISKIRITLKSKALHRDKFDVMGQQFMQEEVKKVNLKRKAIQTSTPAHKRISIQSGSSLSFSNFNASESMEEDELVLSQGSSGYSSQTSMLSDF